MCFPGGRDGKEETSAGDFWESGRGRQDLDTLDASLSRDNEQWPHRANEGEIRIYELSSGIGCGVVV